jgi:hypothetical protein
MGKNTLCVFAYQTNIAQVQHTETYDVMCVRTPLQRPAAPTRLEKMCPTHLREVNDHRNLLATVIFFFLSSSFRFLCFHF